MFPHHQLTLSVPGLILDGELWLRESYPISQRPQYSTGTYPIEYMVFRFDTQLEYIEKSTGRVEVGRDDQAIDTRIHGIKFMYCNTT